MKVLKKNKIIIILLLLAVTTIFVAASVVFDRTFYEKEVEYGKFLKNLQGNTDNVEVIVIMRRDKHIKIRMKDGNWIIPDRYNYPVEAEKIRRVVLNASELEIIERKTDDPDRLEILGLEDFNISDSSSSRILLMDVTEGNIFADFIKGKERRSGKVSQMGALYVRRHNNNQAWLVRGDFDIKLNANSFLNRSIFKIDGKRIKEVLFEFYADNDFVLARSGLENDFKITQPPKKAKNPVLINNLATFPDRSLIFEDVKPDDGESLLGEYILTTSFETFDGLKLYLETYKADDGYWVRIKASSSNENRKIEAESINSVANKWVYRVSNSSGDILTTKLNDLLK